jgi:hypothetical protein
LNKLKKCVIIDSRYENICSYFEKKGCCVIKSIKNPFTYEATSYHPDMQIFIDKYEKIAVIPEYAFEYYREKLFEFDYQCIKGKNPAGSRYPYNISYNGVVTDKYFIHNIKHTEDEIMKHIMKHNKIIINTKQGYTKCSTFTGSGLFITDDADIYKKLVKLGEKTLLTEKGDIVLDGMDYGFIGGATGYDDGRVFITGKLAEHKNSREIINFLENRIIEEVGDGPIIDVGTIIMV